MTQAERRTEIKAVINAMLKDEEFNRGGIFSKEEYYMKKYNLTGEQMDAIHAGLYAILNIDDEFFMNRLNGK